MTEEDPRPGRSSELARVMAWLRNECECEEVSGVSGSGETDEEDGGADFV